MDKEQIDRVLTPEAVEFLKKLHKKFNVIRLRFLDLRKLKQEVYDEGLLPTFDHSTEYIRKSNWEVDPIPEDLQKRTVEITGPVDRKMVINALNSGADCFMADFEDSNSPTWENCIEGQVNLIDAVRKTITYENPVNGKKYSLNENIAKLIVRPRGWHLNEKHFDVDGELISASLFDFGLFFFHNAKELVKNNQTPAFYLPKIENGHEAGLWSNVFSYAENYMGFPKGTIKATVLIETLPAVFQMNEILFNMRNHIVGLNAGRWDYLFSFIKVTRNHKEFTLPDRGKVGMTVPFMDFYVKLLINTCHKRKAYAMGGMAAQIPIKNNQEANSLALGKVLGDKRREALLGHDGTWVAHPGLIEIARGAFNLVLGGKPNNLDKFHDIEIGQDELLRRHSDLITEEGLRNNINVSLHYLSSWFRGQGCVPINNLMEDAATVEISRTQIWQWLKNEAVMEDGRKITEELVEEIFQSECPKVFGEALLPNQTTRFFRDLIFSEDLDAFMTTKAYELLP